MVILGIHTPETDAEKSIDALKKKLKEAGLEHPVAVDNKGTMWRRYHNSYWPSIYLIDKKGVIRYKRIGPLTPEAIDKELRPAIAALAKEQP